MSSTFDRIVETLERHQHVIGVQVGDHRCSCGTWHWRSFGHPKTHVEHVAELIVELSNPTAAESRSELRYSPEQGDAR